MKDLDIIGSEVYAILSNVSKERYNKIPAKITNIFEKYSESAKNIVILPNVEFENQKISQEAKDIIFVIAMNYWLTEDEKKDVMKKLKENEEKIKQNYDIEKIFQQRNNVPKVETEEKDVALVVKKENWLTKIRNFIRKLFKKS